MEDKWKIPSSFPHEGMIERLIKCNLNVTTKYLTHTNFEHKYCKSRRN